MNRLAAVVAWAVCGSVGASGSEGIELDGPLVIGGRSLRLKTFTTVDPLWDVARRFAAEWEKAGLPVVTEGDGVEELVVCAFDTERGLQHAVVLREDAGSIRGFVVEIDWQAEDEAASVEVQGWKWLGSL